MIDVQMDKLSSTITVRTVRILVRQTIPALTFGGERFRSAIIWTSVKSVGFVHVCHDSQLAVII